jgi:hypothetical protein
MNPPKGDSGAKMRSKLDAWIRRLARRSTMSVTLLASTAAVGCAGHPAAPFDTLKNANTTLLRLQNYEPPAQVSAVPGMPTIPGIPPEIQQWAQQAAPALQQLLPPGLMPPGLLGANPLPPSPQAQQQGFRFHNRLVLGTAQMMDQDVREELGDLLGDEDNFQLEHQPCDYAELGVGWSPQPGMPPYEILVSFSCNNIRAAQGFAWPHATGIGMKPKLVQGLTQIVQKLFPTTTVASPPMSSGPPPLVGSTPVVLL